MALWPVRASPRQAPLSSIFRPEAFAKCLFISLPILGFWSPHLAELASLRPLGPAGGVGSEWPGAPGGRPQHAWAGSPRPPERFQNKEARCPPSVATTSGLTQFKGRDVNSSKSTQGETSRYRGRGLRAPGQWLAVPRWSQALHHRGPGQTGSVGRPGHARRDWTRGQGDIHTANSYSPGERDASSRQLCLRLGHTHPQRVPSPSPQSHPPAPCVLSSQRGPVGPRFSLTGPGVLTETFSSSLIH